MVSKKILDFTLLIIILTSCNQVKSANPKNNKPTNTIPEEEIGRLERYIPLQNGLWITQAQIIHNVAYVNNFSIGVKETPFSVSAINLTTGKPIWQSKQDLLLPMTNDEEKIYVFTRSGIVALSMVDGSEVWKANIEWDEDPSDELLASGDGFLFYADRHKGTTLVFALNATTGGMVWSMSLDTLLDPFGSLALPKAGHRSISYNDGHLYLRVNGDYENWKYVALDAKTGNKLWEFLFEVTLPQEGIMTSVASEPVFDNKALYFGTFNRHFYALNKETRAMIWEREQQFEQPAFYADNLFAIFDKYTIGAFDPPTGDLKWSKPFLETGELVSSLIPPVFYKNYLVFYVSVVEAENTRFPRIIIIDITTDEVIYTLHPSFPDDCSPDPLALSIISEDFYALTPNCEVVFRVPSSLLQK
jgi:outer membrane protein assembly factor BamB